MGGNVTQTAGGQTNGEKTIYEHVNKLVTSESVLNNRYTNWERMNVVTRLVVVRRRGQCGLMSGSEVVGS